MAPNSTSTGEGPVRDKKEVINTLLERINNIKPRIDRFYQEFSRYLCASKLISIELERAGT